MILIVAGKYAENKQFFCFDGKTLMRDLGWFSRPEDVTQYVAKIEKIDSSDQLSAGGAVIRGLVGSAILGPAGLLFGLTAKKTKAMFLITWDDGEQTLVEADGEDVRNLMSLALLVSKS